MKITVMGLGYIGLPTAITLAEAGFEVCGFDVNKNTIETLQGGHIPIVEPGLQEAFEKALDLLRHRQGHKGGILPPEGWKRVQPLKRCSHVPGRG